MSWIDALILGIIQGLTEFLPVSSSGHLEIGKVLLGNKMQDNLLFTVVVHGATVLSIILVFYRQIIELVRECLTFRYNDSTAYVLKLFLSMIPIFIFGLFFRAQISGLFNENLTLVGFMLITTSFLLVLTRFVIIERKNKISYPDAFIIGIAQAIAVLPGMSRSGSTIVTGILLGNKKEDVTRFSFLMVIIPIIGAYFIELSESSFIPGDNPGFLVLFIGFISAFITGLFACKWMINLVKKGNLLYFSVYCFLLGISAITFAKILDV